MNYKIFLFTQISLTIILAHMETGKPLSDIINVDNQYKMYPVVAYF